MSDVDHGIMLSREPGCGVWRIRSPPGQTAFGAAFLSLRGMRGYLPRLSASDWALTCSPAHCLCLSPTTRRDLETNNSRRENSMQWAFHPRRHHNIACCYIKSMTRKDTGCCRVSITAKPHSIAIGILSVWSKPPLMTASSPPRVTTCLLARGCRQYPSFQQTNRRG